MTTVRNPGEDWMERRQNPVPERASEETQSDLQAVVCAFGEAWLGRSDGHPLQMLWARRDSQATTELLTLGDALRHLTPIFTSAVRQAVQKIKQDPGERKGFMFELLTLRFLHAAGLDVRPTSKGLPGFDVTIAFPDAPLDISLKNFTRSKQERDLRKAWRVFKASYLAARRSDLQRASGLIVEAERYPTPEEWSALGKAIVDIALLPADGQMRAGPAPFAVTKHPLPAVGQFHDGHVSYQLVTLVPHHFNEDRNLVGKLEEAIENALKHARPGRSAGLMIRMRESADLERYHRWAQDYLDAHAEGPLELIALYQPAWIRGVDNASQLHHGLAVAATAVHRERAAKNGALAFVVPIGTTGGASNAVMRVGNRQLPLTAFYVLQEGRYHLQYGAEADLTSFAPYVETVAHMTIGSENLTLEAIRPATEDFELLD